MLLLQTALPNISWETRLVPRLLSTLQKFPGRHHDDRHNFAQAAAPTVVAYMISRPASQRTRICLSCRLKSIRHRGQISRLTDRAWTVGREATSRDHETHATPWKEEENHRLRPEEDIRLWARYPTSRKLSEHSEHLDVQVLGKPADVVVLRESKIKFTEISHRIDELNPAISVNILEAIDAERERGDPGEKEVMDNIDSFRPVRGAEPRTQADFYRLLCDMAEGFTTPQLTRYLALRMPPKATTVAGPHTQVVKTHKFVKGITRWMPGISKNHDYFYDDPSRAYMSESFNFKQHLTLRILRQCWGLQLRKLEDGLGQIEIELTQQALEHLLRKWCLCWWARADLAGNQPSKLQALSDRTILLPGEKIEAFRHRNVVRLTSARPKSDWLIKEIAGMTKDLSVSTISLEALRPHPGQAGMVDDERDRTPLFTEAEIRQVAKITDTAIIWNGQDQVCLTRILIASNTN